jgi:phage anti-repressor protein
MKNINETGVEEKIMDDVKSQNAASASELLKTGKKVWYNGTSSNCKVLSQGVLYRYLEAALENIEDYCEALNMDVTLYEEELNSDIRRLVPVIYMYGMTGCVDNIHVSGRDIHRYLKIKKPYLDWIYEIKKKWVLDCGFIKAFNNVDTPEEEVDHAIGLEIAKIICVEEGSDISKVLLFYLLNISWGRIMEHIEEIQNLNFELDEYDEKVDRLKSNIEKLKK